MTELAVALSASIVNPDVGDLALDTTGDAYLLTALAQEVAQRLTVRFNLFKGEWFLDQREGTPYYGVVLTKGPTDQVIRSVLGQVITGTEGVTALETFDYAIAGATRALSVTCTARLEDGSTFRSTDYAAFVVAV